LRNLKQIYLDAWVINVSLKIQRQIPQTFDPPFMQLNNISVMTTLWRCQAQLT